MQNKIIDHKEHLALEIKGLNALIFHAVMKLEDAYKYENQSEKHRQLGLFNKYKQFFVGQVENNCFTLPEKLKMYNDMYEVCFRILQHQTMIYKMTPIILKSTNHYLVRIMQKIEKLLPQVECIYEMEDIILSKEIMLEKLKGLRHHYDLVTQGINRTINDLTSHIKQLQQKKIKILNGDKVFEDNHAEIYERREHREKANYLGDRRKK